MLCMLVYGFNYGQTEGLSPTKGLGFRAGLMVILRSGSGI